MQRGRLPFKGGEEKDQQVHWLSGVDRLVVETTTVSKRLVAFVAVQVVNVDGTERQVLRCDDCHGSLHRHLLHEWKERREELGLEMTWENVYWVVAEMKENWLERRNKYLAKIGRGALIDKTH